jgi:hypothetical protein
VSDKTPKKAPQVEVHDLRNIEDVVMLDRSTLDPNRYYRFVQVRDKRIAEMRLRGYTTVSRTEDGVETIFDQEDNAADDTIRVGDTVLMSCPKEVYLRRVAQKRQLSEARLLSPEQRFDEKASRSKVGTVRGDSRKEPGE